MLRKTTVRGACALALAAGALLVGGCTGTATYYPAGRGYYSYYYPSGYYYYPRRDYYHPPYYYYYAPAAPVVVQPAYPPPAYVPPQPGFRGTVIVR